MIELKSKVILLDIEGTTSSVSYVFDVLYPYARNKMPEFLERNWQDNKVKDACNQLAKDIGVKGLDSWLKFSDKENVIDKVVSEANKLMDNDVKATGLKELQGLIWAEGYEAKELKSHVYPDVLPALETWKQQGIDLKIFSSGSINAQKVFLKTPNMVIYANFSPVITILLPVPKEKTKATKQ